MVAVALARPVARDATRICDAAMRVADGDLTARTGVVRNDELGEAAPPIVHVANSAAALASSETRRSFVRAGIAIYGISPGEGLR